MPAEMLPTMTYFAALLGFGVLVIGVTKRFRLPSAFFLLLIGLLFGPTLLGLVDVSRMGDIPDFLRTLALIIIVFAGSFHLKLSTFKRVSNTALKLSFFGFFFSMLILGLTAYYVFGISLIGSFLLGAIVAGTSSSAIIPLRALLDTEESDVLDILAVESIFNDPLTVLVPLLILEALVGGVFSSTLFISQFWQMIAAGVGTGVVVGFAAVEVFRRTQEELSSILSFAIALVTYALASNVGGSGIMAVAICALILGNMKIPFKKVIGEFEDSLSTVLTISVFTLLGAQIALEITPGLLIAEGIFVAVLIFGARPIMTFLCLLKEKHSLSDNLLISFTGPRGVASAAMAAIPLAYATANESLAHLIPEAKIILLTTFLVIMFTLLSSTIMSILYSPTEEAVTKEEPSEDDSKIVLKHLKGK